MPFADPERSKAYFAEYYRRNKERTSEYKRSKYQANPDLSREQSRGRYRKRRRYLSKDALADLRRSAEKDPRIAILASEIVCLGCGLLAKKLSPHLREHGQTTADYKLQWGYNRGTALQARNTTKKQSQSHRLLGSAERLRGLRVKAARRGRGRKIANDPDLRREARLNVGDSQRGQPHQHPKKLISDHKLLIYRWQGKTARAVHQETGLFWPAVARRWKRLGLAGMPMCFLHGEILHGKHISQLCTDTKHTLREAAAALDCNPEYLRRLVRGNRHLSPKLGGRFTTMRNAWLDRRSKLLEYERTGLGVRYKQLLNELGSIRVWLRDRINKTVSRNLSMDDVLAVVAIGIRRQFVLLGRYPQFFDWARKNYGEPAFLRAAWRPRDLAIAFLAHDFRASEKTIERTI